MVDVATLSARFATEGIEQSVAQVRSYVDALEAARAAAQPLGQQLDQLGQTSQRSAAGHKQAGESAKEHATASEHLSTISGQLTERLQAQGVPVGALREGYGKLTESFSAAGQGASGLTVAMGVMAAGVIAGAAVAEQSAEKFLSVVDSVRELREQTGLSAPSIQGLQYALSSVGEGSDSANRALLLFSRNVANASDALDHGKAPSAAFSESISKLHIDMNTFIAANPDERLRMVAEGFSHLGESSDKAQIAMSLFGRGGAGMISVLSQGNALMDEGARKTTAWGASVSEANERGALQFHKAMTDLNLAMTGFEMSVGGPVIQHVAQFAEGLGIAAGKAHELASALPFDPIGKLFGTVERGLPVMQAWNAISALAGLGHAQAAKGSTDAAAAATTQTAAVGDLTAATRFQNDEIDKSTQSHGNLFRQVNETTLAQQQLKEIMATTAASIGLTTSGLGSQAAALGVVNTAVTQASKNAADASTFQQQYASALKFASSSEAERTATLKTLDEEIARGDANQKASATSQKALDEAVATLTPHAADLAVHAQALADAWAKVDANGGDVPAQLDLIKSAATGTKEEVQKLQSEILNLFSKPSSEELQIKAQLADVTLTMDQFNQRLADSSPALQHVAAMQKVYDQALLTGASAKQQADAKAALDRALAETGPAGADVAAGQQRQDQLERTKGSLQSHLTSLQDNRAALAAHTDAAINNAVPIAALASVHLPAVSSATQTATDKTRDFTGTTQSSGPQVISALDPVTGKWTTIGQLIDAATAKMRDFVQQSGVTGTGGGLFGGNVGTTGGPTTFGATGGAGFQPPTTAGPVTQPYGPTNLELEPIIGGQHFHQGIDIGVPVGTPLVAGGAGRVTAIGHQGQSGLGLSVTIDLGNGTLEQIGHLSEALVTVGQQVSAGQTVGLSGGARGDPNSGTSTDPHVHYQVTVNGQTVDPATLATIMTPAAAGGGAATLNGPLPPSWYAAIQANESTLPLPSAGSPQPMFGITASSRAVGRGTFASGGTAAASVSLGVQPGQTSQALFPSTDAGIAAFNDIWQQWPDAVAAAQKGDFPAFLAALVAHGYAGPGEGGQWPGQVLSHFNAGASLPGGATGPAATAASPFGALPSPAPDTSATNITAQLDDASRALAQLSQQQQTVDSSVRDSLNSVTQADVDEARKQRDSFRKTADDKIAAARDADTEWKRLIETGAPQADIDAQKEVAKAATNTANDAIADYTRANTTFTELSRASVQNYTQAQAAIRAETQDTYNAQVTAYNAARQQQHIQSLGQADDHRVVTQQTLASDAANLDSAKALATSAYQAVVDANADALLKHKQLDDDRRNHADQSIIAIDEAEAASADQRLQIAQNYFGQIGQYADESAQRQIADLQKVGASNAAMLQGVQQGVSAQLQTREDQYRFNQIVQDPTATPQARAQAAAALAQIGPLRQQVSTASSEAAILIDYLTKNPGLTPEAVQQVLGQIDRLLGHAADATFAINHLNDTTKQLPPELKGQLATDFNRIVGSLGLNAALQAQANGTLEEVAGKLPGGTGGGSVGPTGFGSQTTAGVMTASQAEEINNQLMSRYMANQWAIAFNLQMQTQAQQQNAATQGSWEKFLGTFGGNPFPDQGALFQQFAAFQNPLAGRTLPLSPGAGVGASTTATVAGTLPGRDYGGMVPLPLAPGLARATPGEQALSEAARKLDQTVAGLNDATNALLNHPTIVQLNDQVLARAINDSNDRELHLAVPLV